MRFRRRCRKIPLRGEVAPGRDRLQRRIRQTLVLGRSPGGDEIIDRNAFVLVFDGMVEWQIALALASLRRVGGVRVVPIGFGPLAVVGLSGLRIIPEGTFLTTKLERRDLVLVPGGDVWERCEMATMSAFLHRAGLFNTWIAGIGTGVIPIAYARLLREREHSSNGRAEGPSWLEAYVRGYEGRELHRPQSVTTSDRVTTAAATASFEFAAELLQEFAGLRPEQLAAWRRLHTNASDGDASGLGTASEQREPTQGVDTVG